MPYKDEFHGIGGTYRLNKQTGKRELVTPSAVMPKKETAPATTATAAPAATATEEGENHVTVQQ